MTSHLKCGLMAAMFLLVLAGCSQPAAKQAVPPAQGLALQPIEENNLRALLQASRGKVVVLNFWATWCVPCREEFPALVELRKRYHAKGAEIYFISMDEPEQLAAVKEFLTQHGVDFPTYYRLGGDFEAMINLVDQKWIGAIPATIFFDRSGKQIKTVTSSHSFAQFEEILKPLI
jgi:thiol-disulfide isomerase/thioredoxin